jgi:hypothetical protein
LFENAKFGDTYISKDCKTEYKCAGNNKVAAGKQIEGCSDSGECVEKDKNVNTCACKKGYKGTYPNCIKSKKFTIIYFMFNIIQFMMILRYGKREMLSK